jgi:thioredoxin reductase
MKHRLSNLSIIIPFVFSIGAYEEIQWTVVGAGPAGIAVVGLLLDAGVQGQQIIWVDPEFNVGGLGKHPTVPGNAKTAVYIDFVNACKSFQECNAPSIETLKNYDLNETPSLQIIIKPLHDITNYLRTKVLNVRQHLTSLYFEQDKWQIGLKNGLHFSSQYVVLATGSHPKKLDYACNNEIPLDIALNKHQLAENVDQNDCIAVIGSAHSAILILKFLSELSVPRVINFYKHPIIYATEMDGWVLHQHSGLKGITAHWAKEVLEKNPPAKIVRIFNTQAALDSWLPICTKIIYAVGYERNELPTINGSSTPVAYDDRSGVIAPRLFGIGIAFPEKYTDPLGNVEYQVGLKFFMEYAQRVVPEWMKKEISCYNAFEDLFIINIL